jgi:hypothetical protein
LTATVLSILVVALFLATSAAAALGPDRPSSRDDEWVPTIVQQGDSVEPKVTPYYINTQSGNAPQSGLLSPAALNETDQLAETTVNGPMAPRFLINNVGSYVMYVDKMPLYIWGVNHVSIWAKSNEDVQGAQFRVHLQKNGQNQRTMSTSPSTLTSAPIEFTALDPPQNFPEPLVIGPGESFGIFIQYTARSRYPIGPAPGCIMLSNTLFHATRIELLAVPMEMNVSTPVFDNGRMHVTGRIVDTSAVDPAEEMYFTLGITTSGGNIVKPGQIVEESFAPDEDKVLINWSWDYKKSSPTDGLFEFKVDVSYGVYGINYTNSTFFELQFPKEKGEDGGFFTGSSMMMWLGILAVVVILAAVVILFYQRSRTPYPTGYQMPRGPPMPKKPKKKMSRKEKKRMEAAKRAQGRPGGSPPSPDRTPMPGKGSPGHGAPPPRGPGAPHGSPRPSTARPRR